MSHCGLFKLLPIILVVCSCTFGEGPELVDPKSDLTTDSTQPQEGNGSSTGSQAAAGQTTAPTSDVQGGIVDDAGSAINTGNTDDADGTDSTDNTDSTDSTDSTDNTDNTDNIDNTDNTDSIDSIDNVSADESNQPSETADAQSADSQSDDQGRIVRIPRTDRVNAPKIDGDTIDYIGGTELLGGEWQFAAQFDGAGEPLGINNLMFGNTDQALAGSNHHWAAMHDGEYLYLVVIVDDEGKHYQDSNEERKLWKDDSIELFFDGNNSLLSEYDGVDDFHLTVNLQAAEGVPNASYVASPKIAQSSQSAALPSDLLFQTGIGKGPQPIGADRLRKDIYEFRIKLSELNIQIEMPFGIEVQMNDDDDGGTRDAKWAWHHPEGLDSTNDNTWQNPSFMGTAILIR